MLWLIFCNFVHDLHIHITHKNPCVSTKKLWTVYISLTIKQIWFT